VTDLRVVAIARPDEDIHHADADHHPQDTEDEIETTTGVHTEEITLEIVAAVMVATAIVVAVMVVTVIDVTDTMTGAVAEVVRLTLARLLTLSAIRPFPPPLQEILKNYKKQKPLTN